MARPTRQIDQQTADHLAAVRERARNAREVLADGSAFRAFEALVGGKPVDDVAQLLAVLEPPAPTDQLAVAAWLNEIDGEDHPRTVAAIDAAQDARYQWNEIAEALGLDSSEKATIRALSQRQRTRRRQLYG